MNSISGSFYKGKFSGREWYIIISGLLVLNFGIRMLIFYKTRLFYFSDYSIYLSTVDNIANGERQYLLNGNMLFAISYVGYFFKYVIGDISYYFIFSSLLGMLSSLIICILVVRITGSFVAGAITIILHSVYTEFMVFSSVFYTPVLMIFLVSLLLLFIYLFLNANNRTARIFSLVSALLMFGLTFFFKPELKYFPFFLLLPGLFFLRNNKSISRKIFLLSFYLLPITFFFQYSGIITHPEGNVSTNDFVMFGHTDYGGDGGEGAFIYPENRERYTKAAKEYFGKKNITSPGASDHNSFNRHEMLKFMTHHPFGWIRLQATKFFRTFGVVPESTSFKILYTGLLKDRLLLTAFVVSAPVAIIILFFILFFSFSERGMLHAARGTRNLESGTRNLKPEIWNLSKANSGFLYFYLVLFIYYIIAIIFYGQYQERYRLTLFVVFIIPAVSYFIAVFDTTKSLNLKSLISKSVLTILFLVIWAFQVYNVISNKTRFDNLIESLR